jgi:hypothetical protein
MVRKQVNELSTSDLLRFPVWEFALDEEGVDGQDETTVRPYQYTGDLDPSWGTFIVRASFVLADGTRMQGYLTPPHPRDRGLGGIHPVITCPQGQILFWRGMMKPMPQEISGSYRGLGKASPAEVFPIRVASEVSIVGGPVRGEIPGFLVLEDFSTGTVRVVT